MEQEETTLPSEEITEDELDLDLTEESEVEAKPEIDYRAEAAKYKRLLEKATKKPALNTPKASDDLAKDIQELKLAEKKRQFGYQNDLSPEETDKLFRFAGDTDPEEVLKDSFFQAALKESRREKKVADATPSTGNRATKVSGKSFAELTPEERASNWDKFVVKK
jgi:hypothetical protein